MAEAARRLRAIADAVLDEALSGHTTAGTLGKAISDIPTAAATADAVLDEALSDHTTTGSLSKKVSDLSNDVNVASFSDDARADLQAEAAEGVLEASTTNHSETGTVGKAIGDAYKGTPPTADAIATEVKNESLSTVASGSLGEAVKSAGALVQRDAPPSASSVATAVKNESLSTTTSGSLGAAVKSAGALVQRDAPPSASDIATAVNNSEQQQIIAGVLAGKTTVSQGGAGEVVVQFRDIADSKVIRTITLGPDDGVRTASSTPDS